MAVEPGPGQEHGGAGVQAGWEHVGGATGAWQGGGAQDIGRPRADGRGPVPAAGWCCSTGSLRRDGAHCWLV